MDISIKLSENVGSSVFQDGSTLLKSEAYSPQHRRILPDGKIQLRAKVRDKFNFVDHPVVETDAAGKCVTEFRCDCPDYRTNHEFCVHCAALVLDFAEKMNLVYATIPEPEAVCDAEEEAVEKGSQPVEKAPCLTDFSYKFCNSSWDLYPRIREPRIPQERYIQAFGDIARARSIYRMAGLWGGSCYGMSSTATMFQQSNEDTLISDFNESARIPSELQLGDCHQTLDMTLHQYIEMMQILQYSQCIRHESYTNRTSPNCLQILTQRVEEFHAGKAGPVIMHIWKNPKLEGGHAIVPYRLERTDDSEDILHIYDPNKPLVTSYAYLQKDEQGNYLNWRFPMSEYNVYSSSETGAALSMTTYEVYKTAWDNRGGPEVDNILSIKAGTAVKNTEGELLVRVTDNGVESYRDDIYQISVTEGGANGEVMISLPAGQYVICQEDLRENELSVHMAGIDLSVVAAATASEVVVQVEDESKIASVQIPQNSRYHIEILNTSAQTPEEVFLSGMTEAEKLNLIQKEGQLYADGLTTQCSLYINDVQQSLDRIIQMPREVIPEEIEPELVLSTTFEEKKEDNED